MKRVFVFLVIVFSYTNLFGQKDKVKPLIIKGQIKDFPERYLNILFWDKHGQKLVDTLHLDKKGNFYYISYSIDAPQRVRILKNKIGIDDLFVAPGYDLTITASVNDGLSLDKNLKLTGIGAESNRYYFLLDSILRARKETIRSYELNEADLLSYIKNNQKLKDSVVHTVFDKKPVQDNYLKYFGSLVQMDNMFNKLYMLILHVKWNNYNYEKSVSFIRDNFDNKILDNLYKDENLASYNYRTWIVGGQWIDYLVHLDYQKDSTLKNQKDYSLKKISETYLGKVREFALFDRLEYSIHYSNSFEEFNDAIAQYETYGAKLKNLYYKKTLESKLAEKKAVLFRAQVGKSAPTFSLQSNLGTTYSLEDFKGKVLYLDLWASWCISCREETPAMRVLYDKYKNDNRIVIVGIAVQDGLNSWKKAIEEDKPEWIQLLDPEGIVLKAYAADEIPRFILIDKQGKIVDFNAPSPSSGKEIETVLNREILK